MFRQFFSYIFIVFYLPVCFANITVSIEPNKTTLDEPIRLILTTDSSLNLAPDLTPLEKDFNILGTERRMSYSIINGQTHSQNQWIIILQPLHHGVLTIPSLQIGQEKTLPQQLEVVTDASHSTPASQEDVMLTTEVSEDNPYIHQKVIYTVKLFHTRAILNADYKPPQVNNSLFISLGQDKRYQIEKDGRLYTVEELRYVLFPQKSGPLSIKAPIIQGLLEGPYLKPVRLEQAATNINVKSIPLNKKKNWLPAEKLSLSENYSHENSILTEGSTLTRTITIQAHGIPGQLLPVLHFEENDQYTLYPEKPKEQNLLKQNTIIGQSTTEISYLFNKPGQIVIPKLTIKWFNTNTGQDETAFLPERQIEIKANTALTPKAERTPEKEKALTAASSPSKNLTSTLSSFANGGWWLALGLGFLWLLTIGGWLLKKNTSRKPNEKIIFKNIKNACLKNDPQEARNYLLQWAKIQWPEAKILNLGDMKKLILNENLNASIQILIEALYRPRSTLWNGKALWEALHSFKKTPSKQNKPESLPPIHRL